MEELLETADRKAEDIKAEIRRRATNRAKLEGLSGHKDFFLLTWILNQANGRNDERLPIFADGGGEPVLDTGVRRLADWGLDESVAIRVAENGNGFDLGMYQHYKDGRPFTRFADAQYHNLEDAEAIVTLLLGWLGKTLTGDQAARICGDPEFRHQYRVLLGKVGEDAPSPPPRGKGSWLHRGRTAIAAMRRLHR